MTAQDGRHCDGRFTSSGLDDGSDGGVAAHVDVLAALVRGRGSRFCAGRATAATEMPPWATSMPSRASKPITLRAQQPVSSSRVAEVDEEALADGCRRSGQGDRRRPTGLTGAGGRPHPVFSVRRASLRRNQECRARVGPTRRRVTDAATWRLTPLPVAERRRRFVLPGQHAGMCLQHEMEVWCRQSHRR